MTENHWYPFYVGDYSRHTAHLSMLEHGAYRLLLDHYYSTNQPLPAHAQVLHRICRAFAGDEQAAVQSVLQQFFTERGGYYHNERADGEIEKRKKISKVRARAAKIRHSKTPHANAHTTTATTTTTIKSSSAMADVGAFQQIFDGAVALFPRLATSSTSAIHGWLEAGCKPDMVLAEIKRSAGKNVGSFSYFSGAVMDAKATLERGPPKGQARNPSKPAPPPKTNLKHF